MKRTKDARELNFLFLPRTSTCGTYTNQHERKKDFGHQVRVVCGLLIFIIFVFLFMGCQPESDDAGNLDGTWVNISQSYETIIKINAENKTVEYTGSYNATIENSPNFISTNGVLIIKFTKYGDWGEEPTTEHTNVGRYGALYWVNMGLNSVKLADAYIGWDHAITETLQEAQEMFTIDKVGDYIDWAIIGVYTK